MKMNAPIAIQPPIEAAPAPRHQRAQGSARVSFKRVDDVTRLDRLYQSGSAKVKLPSVFGGEPTQAVFINTAGGLTGGDRMSAEVALGEHCRAVVTTQACERIYRSAGGAAEVTTHLTVGAGARLDWLPQETILFNGGRLSRRLEADPRQMPTLLAKPSIFGRADPARRALRPLADRCALPRGKCLRRLSALRLVGCRTLGQTAVSRGAPWRPSSSPPTTFATLETSRAIIGPAGGASSWNGKLLARMIADSGAALRATLIPALDALLDGAALPRIWRM